MEDTLQDIREECQRRLREISGAPVFWPVETLNKYINDGCLDIVRRTGCLWDRIIFDVSADDRSFTLPTNVFEIPRKRVVYDETNHLEFKTLDLMDEENEKWESNASGTPQSWVQKDTRTIYIDPPATDAGETYTYDADIGRVVQIVDSENTYTFSSEVGRVVRIQDDNAEGDCYSFTSETGIPVRMATPVGNISIWYKKEPDELVNSGDSSEMHEIFKYVVYSYVLWKALSLKGEGQNLKIAGVHLEEYELQLTDLMAIGKSMIRGHRTRLQD